MKLMNNKFQIGHYPKRQIKGGFKQDGPEEKIQTVESNIKVMAEETEARQQENNKPHKHMFYAASLQLLSQKHVWVSLWVSTPYYWEKKALSFPTTFWLDLCRCIVALLN